MWAFRQLHDKGLVYEGFRCLPYCWNDETPLSAHELRMDEDVYQMRQDPAVTVGYRLETGELALIWTTTPWTLPSNLAMAVHQRRRLRGRRVRLHRPHRALRAGRRPAGRLRARAGRGRRSDRPAVQGRRPGRAALHPAVQLLPGPRQVARRAARRLRDHRRRHRHRAHRAGLRRGRQAAHRPVRDRAGGPGRPGRQVHLPGRRSTPGSSSSTPTCRSSITCRPRTRRDARGRRGRRRRHHRGHGAAAPRDLRPLLPALLAVPPAAHLHGRVLVVRVDHHDQGPDARAERADHLGARARQARPVRQVAGEHQGLVDQPEPVLGQPDPGVEVGQPGLPAGRRVRLAGSSCRPTSASRSPTCTGPPSTS